MKIAEIDFYSHQNNTWLHKTPISIKIISLFLVVLFAILCLDFKLLAMLCAFLLLEILIFRLPLKKIILLTLYPVIFLIVYFLSIKNISIEFIFLILFRVFAIVLSLLILVFTTPYIRVFEFFSKFMPNILMKVFFLTFRSIFILTEILENILIAVRLRGKVNFGKPIETIKILSNIVGYLIITALERSEKMYYGLKLRGYLN